MCKPKPDLPTYTCVNPYLIFLHTCASTQTQSWLFPTFILWFLMSSDVRWHVTLHSPHDTGSFHTDTNHHWFHTLYWFFKMPVQHCSFAHCVACHERYKRQEATELRLSGTIPEQLIWAATRSVHPNLSTASQFCHVKSREFFNGTINLLKQFWHWTNIWTQF